MRFAIRVLFVLALPGLIFGFLNSVRTDQPGVYDPMLPPADPDWLGLVPALLMVPPMLLVAYAIYVVVDWLTREIHPDRRAKP
ncbi:hypothetical protein OJ997_18430 [Solirubrobacter phytolaccae]|uniref:Uncharacterized protein n=1 Tax=Solirubrobacter phytolaccae TaxID=1404360 RepID=A0A9X3N969_9ACTN|nr:hypothetical protein [Solirubrobacter phytolaccae]MDA0182290.1 hypothetical protein [Solirubrobacter phytolaccae]